MGSVKAFFNNKRNLIILIVLATVLIIMGLLWLIYTKDQPKIVPAKAREEVRGGIKEGIAEPLQKVIPPVGEAMVKAEYNPSRTTPSVIGTVLNLQTYTDESGLFSFKYPTSYFLRKGVTNLIVADEKNRERETEYPEIIIESYQSNITSVNQWIDTNKEKLIGDQKPSEVEGFENRKPVVYSNFKGVELSIQSMGEDRITVLKRDNTIIVIQGLSLSSFQENIELNESYYKILNTLN